MVSEFVYIIFAKLSKVNKKIKHKIEIYRDCKRLLNWSHRAFYIYGKHKIETNQRFYKQEAINKLIDKGFMVRVDANRRGPTYVIKHYRANAGPLTKVAKGNS